MYQVVIWCESSLTNTCIVTKDMIAPVAQRIGKNFYVFMKKVRFLILIVNNCYKINKQISSPSGQKQFQSIMISFSIFLLTLTLALTVLNALPIQYRGWINNCSLYFQPNSQPAEYIDDLFLHCNIHFCEARYLYNCDRLVPKRYYSLAECMKFCCNDDSHYRTYNNVLDFIDQCQLDYIKQHNEQIEEINRLPLLIFIVSVVGVAIFILICYIVIYSQEIITWVRQRYRGGGRQNPGIQMQNLLH